MNVCVLTIALCYLFSLWFPAFFHPKEHQRAWLYVSLERANFPLNSLSCCSHREDESSLARKKGHLLATGHGSFSLSTRSVARQQLIAATLYGRSSREYRRKNVTQFVDIAAATLSLKKKKKKTPTPTRINVSRIWRPVRTILGTGYTTATI